MSLFDKYVKANAIKAEEEDEEQIVTEAEFEEDESDEYEAEEEMNEDEEVTAEAEDELVDEVVEAVEEEMEETTEALRTYIRKNKMSKQAVAVLLDRLNTAGILIANPYAGKFGKVRLSKKESELVRAAYIATVEATEDALAMAAKILASKGGTTRQGKALDRKLAKDGFVRSCVAAPIPLKSTVRKAEKAVSKTRPTVKASRPAGRRGLRI